MKHEIFFFIAMFSITVICQSTTIDNILSKFENKSSLDLFKVYHLLYSKQYDLNTEEALQKYRVFKQNVEKIKEVNSQKLSYKVGINKFTDLTDEEFNQQFLMSSESYYMENPIISQFLGLDGFSFSITDKFHISSTSLSGSNEPIDYRNFYQPVRNQGKCGSMFAFSTLGALEGNIGKKNNKPSEYLSIQQFVDCDAYDWGCNGGIFEYSYKYLQENGVVKDTDYPYLETKNDCKTPSNAERVKLNSFEFCSNYYPSSVRKCSEEKIYSFLKKGPLSITIDGAAIKNYKSGIFNGECKTEGYNVVLVGYGTENGKDYYIVRNSWGENWGEKGYIRIEVNDKNNHSCFVGIQAFLPNV